MTTRTPQDEDLTKAINKLVEVAENSKNTQLPKIYTALIGIVDQVKELANQKKLRKLDPAAERALGEFGQIHKVLSVPPAKPAPIDFGHPDKRSDLCGLDPSVVDAILNPPGYGRSKKTKA